MDIKWAVGRQCAFLKIPRSLRHRQQWADGLREGGVILGRGGMGSSVIV